MALLGIKNNINIIQKLPKNINAVAVLLQIFTHTHAHTQWKQRLYFECIQLQI